MKIKVLYRLSTTWPQNEDLIITYFMFVIAFFAAAMFLASIIVLLVYCPNFKQSRTVIENTS